MLLCMLWDWTIETIFNQINIGNIDLNPNFKEEMLGTMIKEVNL